VNRHEYQSQEFNPTASGDLLISKDMEEVQVLCLPPSGEFTGGASMYECSWSQLHVNGLLLWVIQYDQGPKWNGG
jgi:hypothetical protein